VIKYFSSIYEALSSIPRKGGRGGGERERGRKEEKKESPFFECLSGYEV
jgi:hypothetical protein